MVIVIYNNNKNRSIMIVMKNRRMLKINKFVKHGFFLPNVIYLFSRERLFPHISVANITTFPSTTLKS